jgi:hypothetical protein
LQPLYSITDKLVDNFPCGLLVFHNSSDLAHQERARIVHCLVIKIVAQLLEVVLDRQYALAGELLDLARPVLFPVCNVWVVADTERSAREDDCADVVVPASSSDGLLVSLGSASLLRQNEASADPYTSSTKCEHGGQRLAVVHASGCDDEHLLPGQGRLVALDHLNSSGDEDGGGDISGVASALTTLCADNVDAEVEALLDVLGVADHVHVENAGLVELLDDSFGRYTDGTDEEFGTRIDDDVDELVQLALGVVVAIIPLATCIVPNSNQRD